MAEKRRNMKTKTRIHFGWYVVVAVCFATGMSTGIISNVFGQFIKPVCAGLNFTRQQMSMNQTIISAIALAFAMVWGSLSKKIRLHRWMCVAAVVQPLMYFSYSFAANLVVFYGITVVLGIFNCFLSLMVFSYIIGNWFVKGRGTALGLASMGTGIGGMIMNPVASSLIVSFGWQRAYQVIGLLMFVIIAPAVWFIIREKPADKGLLPCGYDEAPEEKETRPTVSAEGYTFAEAVKMPAFWALGVVSSVMVMMIFTYTQTLSPHLSDSGYSVEFAAMMASVSMAALAVGKVILGRLFDKLGVRTAVTIACGCTWVGIVGMIFCNNPVSLAAIILGVGLGCSFGAVCVPIITQSVFGMKDYNAIYGKLYAGVSMGGVLSPIVSGWTYDVSGSYIPIYIAAAVSIFISILVLRWAIPKGV